MRNRSAEVLIKKYSNRRLYDTSESKYITLEELTAIIRSGRDVRIVDAKTNEDLTQITLAQMFLESGRAARLLPQPLLIQLVRMSDDSLAEFFGRYMTWALEIYNQAKTGAAALAPYNPFATLPFAATNALARFWGSAPMWSNEAGAAPPPGAGAYGPPPGYGGGAPNSAAGSGTPPMPGAPGTPPTPGAPGMPPMPGMPGVPPWMADASYASPAAAPPSGSAAEPPPDDDEEPPPDEDEEPTQPAPPKDELAELKRQIEELKRVVMHRD